MNSYALALSTPLNHSWQNPKSLDLGLAQTVDIAYFSLNTHFAADFTSTLIPSFILPGQEPNIWQENHSTVACKALLPNGSSNDWQLFSRAGFYQVASGGNEFQSLWESWSPFVSFGTGINLSEQFKLHLETQWEQDNLSFSNPMDTHLQLIWEF